MPSPNCDHTCLDIIDSMLAEISFDQRSHPTPRMGGGGNVAPFDGEVLGKYIRRQLLLEVRGKITGEPPERWPQMVCELSVGDRFWWKGSRYRLSYKARGSVEATGDQFSNIVTFIEPAYARKGDERPSIYTEVELDRPQADLS